MKNLAIDLKEYLNRDDMYYLLSFRTKIEKLREKLYIYAESITEPLNKILVAHYKERLSCAEGRPMLGEYAIFLAGDLFLIKPQVVDKLAFPWLLLYEYSLLLDDLLDGSRSHWSHELLLSQILLESSITEYKKLLGDNKSLWAAYNSYQREWINEMMHEMKWSCSKENQSKTGAIFQQGRKAAMVKFCVTSIVYLDKNRLLTSREEKGIDHLCAGIQLLDDLTDVLEDHRAGRLNVLLGDTYEWFNVIVFNSISNIHPKDVSVNQLMLGLVYSGAISNSWKIAAKQIDKAIEMLQDKENQSTKYFKSISIKCRESSRLIDKAIRDMPELQEYFLNTQIKGENTNIIEINTAKLSQMLSRITRHINNGPKASN